MTNNKPFIEFKKQRDFGLLLSDTFSFIRNEYNPFFKAIFNIAGPLIVLFIICMWFYTNTVGDAFNFYIKDFSSFNNPMLFFVVAIAYFISAILAYVFSVSTALHYIKSYVDNNGQVDIKTLKTNVYDTFWEYLGLGFLKWLVLLFSAILCFFPVFYAMVPMFIVFCIFIFEPNRGVMGSLSYSFTLINEDFWKALGTIFVMVIILSIISLVFAVPSLIYTYTKMGIFSGEFDPGNMDSNVNPVYIFFTVLNTIAQFLLNIILVVASAFLYFHLNEKKHDTGTLERISNIGKVEE